MKIQKIFILVFAVSLKINISFGQQPYQDIPVKEKFDDVYSTFYDEVAYQYPIDELTYNEEVDRNVPDNFGTYWAGTLDGLLDMYELTRDKAYLYKFIYPALHLQTIRGQCAGCTQSMYSYQMYHNGRAVWLMAHFVYLVYNSDLYGEPLLDVGSNSHYHPLNYYGNYSTFGDIANTFYSLVQLTIDNADWIGDAYAFRKESNTPPGSPASLNEQAPWGLALTYMYLASRTSIVGTELTAYGAKAAAMAALYMSDIDMENKCTCDSYHSLLLKNSSYNNSYWWYHNGWRIVNDDDCPLNFSCFPYFPHYHQPKIGDYLQYKEDIGHGLLDILFPVLYNKYSSNFYPHITGNDYFENQHLVKFRNTFGENIFDDSGGNKGFHASVDGQDAGTYLGSNYQFNYDTPDALAWMPLYKWDGMADAGAHNVYNINMDFFRDVIQSKTINDDYHKYAPYGNLNANVYFAAPAMKGIASTAAAQWDKECFNLTLKNRDVVYNQDFFAKNTLTVDPTAQNDFVPVPPNGALPYAQNSFADPVITVDKFIIEPGKTVNMSAGSKIILKNGFHAKAGCKFRAYLDPSLAENCGSGKTARMAGGGDNGSKKGNGSSSSDNGEVVNQPAITSQQTETKNSQSTIFNQQSTITIVPNPSASGIFQLSISGNNFSAGNVTVTNVLGEMVYQSANPDQRYGTGQLINLSANQYIDISTQPKGIYFVKLTDGAEMSVQKIVYQ